MGNEIEAQPVDNGKSTALALLLGYTRNTLNFLMIIGLVSCGIIYGFAESRLCIEFRTQYIATILYHFCATLLGRYLQLQPRP